ncbi:MAG: response regulator [Chthoniobacterales bacterium]
MLLVEEYKALAIAFSSALRKFADDVQVRVVGSLKEADQLLDDLRPTLLVIDCDPPPRHGVKFFERLRTLLPNSRVLIVAAENAEEFTNQQALRPALEFIKKPFELTKFGSVIQRLLAKDSSELGTLRHLRLLDMILLHAITAAEVVLRVEAPGERSGEIHFADGRIIHAAVMGKAGVEALRTMLGWRSARFREGERTLDSPRTIHGEWAEILREVLPASSPEPVPTSAKEESVPPSPSRKIVVVDDTELLLHFAEDVLVTSHPEWEVTIAASGFDGLKFIAADKPDLLLLDYDLPDLTGADVCEKLLANENTAGIPVVMMSGHVAEMIATAERFENVVATIAKPFLSSSLIELVEQTLRAPPKRRAPLAKKKTPAQPPPPEVTAPTAEAPEGSRNGGEHPREPAPSNTKAKSSATHGLAEEDIPASILDPSPAVEQEIEKAAESSKAIVAIPPATPEKPTAAVETPRTVTPQVPVGIRNARSNAVVLGLPVEVRVVDFSAQLRVKEIRARPVSSSVWLHVLPETMAQPLRQDKPFRLSRVNLLPDGQVDLVHVAPMTTTENFTSPRYRLTIDAVDVLLADDSDTIRLAPTAVDPMRLELLALFELCGVELSAQFSVQNLLLKMRDKRVRATFLPEAMHIGATLTIAELSLTESGTINELRLIAV